MRRSRRCRAARRRPRPRRAARARGPRHERRHATGAGGRLASARRARGVRARAHPLVYVVLLVGVAAGGRGRRLPARDRAPASRRAGLPAAARRHARATCGPSSCRSSPILLASWALGGLYLSLGPSVAAGLLGHHRPPRRRAWSPRCSAAPARSRRWRCATGRCRGCCSRRPCCSASGTVGTLAASRPGVGAARRARHRRRGRRVRRRGPRRVRHHGRAGPADTSGARCSRGLRRLLRRVQRARRRRRVRGHRCRPRITAEVYALVIIAIAVAALVLRIAGARRAAA